MKNEKKRTRTGGRAATTGVILGDYSLSVGNPNSRSTLGWKWTKLTNVARLESGHTPSRKHPEYWNGDIPWIGIRDATANDGRTIFDTNQHTNELGILNSSARVLPINTVCLSRTASVGYIVVMGREMATSQDFVNWVCDPELLDYLFLKYVLLSEKRSFLRFAHGTTHQTIYFPEVKAFHINLPPLPEQKAIAQILGSLDDKIELNRQMNATLEAMAQALFKSWFVDFDPVMDKLLASGKPIPEALEAKAARRRAVKENSEYPPLPDDLQGLFPDAFVFSEELGKWIPEGWESGKIADISINIKNAITPEKIQSKTPYIGLQNMPQKSISLSEWGDSEDVKSNKYTFNKGDILFGKLRPYFHKVGIAPIDGICSTDILVIKPKQNDFLALVLGHLTSQEFIAFVTRASTGTRMPRTNWKDMGKYSIVIPDTEIATYLSKHIQRLTEKISFNIFQKNELTSLRDTLLPQLISGKLSVSDFASKMAAVGELK